MRSRTRLALCVDTACFVWELHAEAAAEEGSAPLAGESAGVLCRRKKRLGWAMQSVAGSAPDCCMHDWRDAARLRVHAGSLLLRRHAQTGSYLTCTIRSGICGRLVCLDATPPSCFAFALTFPLFSERLGFVLPRGRSFRWSCCIMRLFVGLRRRRRVGGLGAQHEQ